MANSDVNVSDAQAFQKYIDRFEEQRSSQAEENEVKKEWRIAMDRKIVYGRPSKGRFRNELTPQQMQRLLDAFRQPVTLQDDPATYQGSVPAIEVKLGDEILLHQERDGVVTINQFQQQAEAAPQTQTAEITAPTVVEDPWLSEDSDRDGLTNREEAMLGTNPYSADTDRDGVSDFQEVMLGTDPTNPNINRDSITTGNELRTDIDSRLAEPTQEPSEQAEGKQSFVQDPSIPALNTELDKGLQPDTLGKNVFENEQPSFINTLYQRLRERSDIDLDNATLSVFQASNPLYQGTFQVNEFNVLTPAQQDLLQKTLDDPTGLKGELTINVNDQMIFHVENGEIKLDQYRIAGSQQLAEAQGLSQAETTPQPDFDTSAIYNHYRQEVQGESLTSTEQDPIYTYERIAQKALENGLSQEQTKQVLKQDPFHQSLALSLGQQEAERYTGHLLNSLGSQTTPDDRVAALENRVQSLESFNQHLSSQLDTVNQKLERLSQSKAFKARSPQLNQFLGNVWTTFSNTLQAAKNALRQQVADISLYLVDASAKISAQKFGEESKDGLRVIDASNGKRIGLNQHGDILITKSPTIQATSLYQRFSKGVNSGLPPSIQVKQIAQAALKEKFTNPQIYKILSESPKFKEINSTQGPDKANQFASVAIAAAQRQNIIDARPRQQEQQKQKQHQA